MSVAVLVLKLFIGAVLLFTSNVAIADEGGEKFIWPIGCIPGKSCVGQHFRIGYPDIEGKGRSFVCGKPGYKGHQGTDVIVSSVEQDVPVFAAADGTVRWIKDGNYDRCPDSSRVECSERQKSVLPSEDLVGGASLGFNAGNYVVLEHRLNGTRYLTLYAHLRSGSQKVAPGQRVVAGDLIASVGSSGNSRIPHLHFGVFREDGPYYRSVDPWKGPCNSSSDGLWVSDPPYLTDDSDTMIPDFPAKNRQVWPAEPE